MCDAQADTMASPFEQGQAMNNDEFRKVYDSIASAQAALLDKSIISISGASFSITIGFIDKLIPLAFARATWLLWFALLILALSIITTTLSFWAGEKTARLKSKVCGQICEHEYDSLRKSADVWSKLLSILNGGRLICFLLGITLLAGFIFFNGIAGITSKIKEPTSVTIQQIVEPNIGPTQSVNGTEQSKEQLMSPLKQHPMPPRIPKD